VSSEWASSISDVLALARLQRDGRAWLVVAQSAALAADPTAAFTAAAGRGRMLLWQAGEWLLGIGTAHEVTANGPGRQVTMASAVAELRAKCVVAGDVAVHLPCLMHAQAFADRPAGGAWGDLPGSRVVLPRRLLGRHVDGRSWIITAVAVRAGDSADSVQAALAAEPPIVSLVPAQPWPAVSDESFTTLVDDAAALIRDGAMRKVVLARAVDVVVGAGRAVESLLVPLREAGGADSTVYAVDLPDGACFVGATPELLFAGEGRSVRVMALAGSTRRGTDVADDTARTEALCVSTKERKEHQLVVEHMTKVLRPRCRPFTIPLSPHSRVMPRIVHLETLIDVELETPDHLELLGALHPTPAVCGLPTATALNYLTRREHLPRGLYAGVLGWATADRCRFSVALRGGIIRGQQARLFAGAGIVETSDPAAELAETEAKLDLMRGILA